MDHTALMVLLSVWSSGLLAEDSRGSTVTPDDVRLAGGSNHCSGRLEMRHQGDWTPVDGQNYYLTSAAAVCRQLHCGSVVSVRRTWRPFDYSAPFFLNLPTFQLRESEPERSFNLDITCSESVRLVNGANQCSGRLEVKSNQSWSLVCEDDFDLQDAEVVCREVGCGAPSVLQGALYGEVEAPMWTREFQCAGNESLLLDCDSSGPARKSCSSGKAVGLTCSDPDDVRLVGGDGHCTGKLELKHHGAWKAVANLDYLWDPEVATLICARLDCGSSVSAGRIRESTKQSVWWIDSSCVQSKRILRDCVTIMNRLSASVLEITCSESVRLVNGVSRCSGRLEVKSNQSWSSVCEDDFDLQDAEVVCRELGCGSPSVLQGALYGKVEAPMWTREFQCDGNESLLLDCDSSGPARKTCSSGKAVGLTCSAQIHMMSGWWESQAAAPVHW
ncbi:scavenger receptor cysteine-rich type 1 protein M130 isoform X2 [Lates calcarifer]|uniref:Scavenger receptor cysteine-rich type 1 protein M130 isoform X2 n=1 Tax=Lates calcarifer TaxID=8187 RepID=A0AAJ8DJM8_LATCA|nr:scavenger receptor cysteine-rich type 1 protein M130 isoform X2 [Lates calcarifer]